tara:strand:- start:170 stop:457 length:288 start_codon:yes stop_codon:yes gene_type:complete
METNLYFVVVKVSVSNEELEHTPIGYVLNLEDADSIKEIHYQYYEIWVELNMASLERGTISITDFPGYPIHEIGWVTTSIGDLSIGEITDFINLT